MNARRVGRKSGTGDLEGPVHAAVSRFALGSVLPVDREPRIPRRECPAVKSTEPQRAAVTWPRREMRGHDDRHHPARRLVPGDHGLTVVALALPDRTVHASVADSGNLNHPATGARSPASSPSAGPPSAITSETTHAPPSCCASAGGGAAVEGPVELAGPGDPLNGGGAERLRLLLREIYTAAGGTHDDYAAYDKAMAAERRMAVLVTSAGSTTRDGRYPDSTPGTRFMGQSRMPACPDRNPARSDPAPAPDHGRARPQILPGTEKVAAGVLHGCLETAPLYSEAITLAAQDANIGSQAEARTGRGPGEHARPGFHWRVAGLVRGRCGLPGLPGRPWWPHGLVRTRWGYAEHGRWPDVGYRCVLRLADIGDRGDFARPPADGADSVVHRLPWPCAYTRLAGGTVAQACDQGRQRAIPWRAIRRA